jgi:thymidylate synthase (FAD)
MISKGQIWKYYDGSVTISDWMGNDLTVVNAARVSFGKSSSELAEKDEKLINYLAVNHHLSPFRHIQVSLILAGIPEIVMRQLYKHQVGVAYTSGEFREVATCWNEISGRYVEFEPDFFQPRSFRKQHDKNKQGSYRDKAVDNEAEAIAIYRESVASSFDNYKKLLDLGVCKEQARMVLPLSFKTSVIWTASLEALVHFVKLRDHESAQVEIQDLAKIVHDIIKEIAPVSTKALLERKS